VFHSSYHSQTSSFFLSQSTLTLSVPSSALPSIHPSRFISPHPPALFLLFELLPPLRSVTSDCPALALHCQSSIPAPSRFSIPRLRLRLRPRPRSSSSSHTHPPLWSEPHPNLRRLLGLRDSHTSAIRSPCSFSHIGLHSPFSSSPLTKSHRHRDHDLTLLHIQPHLLLQAHISFALNEQR
jgi:hypothetical protein